MPVSRPPHILIVDDNPFNRELISDVAQLVGFIVQEAKDGHQALALIRDNRFTLVMLDLLMPGMDGFETARKIREMGIDIPIVAVSALTMKQDRQRSFRSGCNEFLSKPLDIKELKSLLITYASGGVAGTNPSPMEQDPVRTTSKVFGDTFLVLVEEDRPLREQKSRFLVQAGFQVETFANGFEAFGFMQTSGQKVKIIISNIFTSGIDGLGLLTLVKRQYAHILVFLYTESYDPSTFQYAVQQKVDGIIPQDQFDDTALDIIKSALSQSGQKGSRTSEARTAALVREAQAQLIQPGCMHLCPAVDVAYQALQEAGGDMMRCRRFGREGLCGLLLADVAGHSVMSSYTSATFTGILMSVWDRHQDPLTLLKKIDGELIKVGNDKSHICATAVLWDRWSGKFNFASAGNPGGLMVTFTTEGKAEFKALPGGGMVLGALENHDLFVYGSGTLPGNTYLFLFSDGIDNAELKAAIEENSGLFDRSEIKGLCQQLMDAILEKKHQTDDMILLCMHNEGEPENAECISGFSSTYEAVDQACLWVDNCLPQGSLPKGHDRDFVLLSVREALLNAVEHGNARNSSAHFETAVYRTRGQVKITITDEGKGFNLSENLRKPSDLTFTQIGKRGLSLMNSVASRLIVKNGSVSLIYKENNIREGQ